MAQDPTPSHPDNDRNMPPVHRFGRRGLWAGSAVALLAVVNWVGTNEPAARLAAPPEGTLLHQAGIQSGDWVQRASVGGKEWQPVITDCP